MTKKQEQKPSENADELPFEQVLSRLTHVVDKLEEGDLPLEEALAIFEQGVRLSRMGSRRLDEAERKIEVLLNDSGEPKVAPFEEQTP